MQAVPLHGDRVWNSSALQVNGDVASPSAASHSPNHPASLPQLETGLAFWHLWKCLASSPSPYLPFLLLGTPCFSSVESSAIPQTVRFHGAVPLLIPVAPPGVNLPVWTLLLRSPPDVCMDYTLFWNSRLLISGSSKRMTSVQLSGLLRTVPAASSPNLGAESSLPLPIAWGSPYFSTCNAELKPFLICIPLSDRAQTLVRFIH